MVSIRRHVPAGVSTDGRRWAQMRGEGRKVHIFHNIPSFMEQNVHFCIPVVPYACVPKDDSQIQVMNDKYSIFKA